MDWRLFLGTFVLIFIAELGDKTQLTAMAKATSSDGGKWTVFLAASAALMLSTLIAVLIGGWLQKNVDERIIKGVAAGLFIVFGLLLLREVVSPEEAKEEVSAPATAPTGFLAHVAFEIAAGFEHAAARHYRELAEHAQSPALKELLLALAAEEDAHLKHVHELAGKHAEAEIAAEEPAPDLPRLPAAEGVASDEATGVLKSVIEHEEAKAEFYSSLARDLHIPGLRDAFAQLAAEERDHARRVREALGS